jgi:hypothetical protein
MTRRNAIRVVAFVWALCAMFEGGLQAHRAIDANGPVERPFKVGPSGMFDDAHVDVTGVEIRRTK